MKIANFFAELKRRNVYKVAVAYAVVAWLLIQAASILFPTFEAPGWVMKVFVAVVAAGFPIALILAWAFELTPEGLKRTEFAGELPTKAPRNRAWIYVVTIGGAISIGLFFLGRYTATSKQSGSVEVPTKSIAVLPLVNTSADPGNDYFSDGLSEELIAVLAKIPGLKIIGRSSSFLFKGKSDDSRMIGEKLGVTNLLEGSVRKQGDRVRIVADLINAVDGRELWTETYDRELKDVFAVQSEIATAVAGQLKIKLLGPPPQSDAAPLNENLAAYTALQQGNFYASRGNEEGDRRAIEFYDEAIRLDPTYALAYAQLAGVWQNLAERFLGGDELVAAYGKARSTAQMALSLPPNLSEAHQVMGEILMITDHNYDEAAIQFRQAEALAPGTGDPKASLAYLLFAQGRLPEAEEMARKAQALNPLALGLNLVRILIARERYDEAEALLRRAIQMRPKVSTDRKSTRLNSSH